MKHLRSYSKAIARFLWKRFKIICFPLKVIVYYLFGEWDIILDRLPSSDVINNQWATRIVVAIAILMITWSSSDGKSTFNMQGKIILSSIAAFLLCPFIMLIIRSLLRTLIKWMVSTIKKDINEIEQDAEAIEQEEDKNLPVNLPPEQILPRPSSDPNLLHESDINSAINEQLQHTNS